MGLRDSPLCPDCGVEDSVTHLFTTCARGDVARADLFPLGTSIPSMLADPARAISYLRRMGRL